MNETATEALNLIDQLKEQQLIFTQQLDQLHAKLDEVIDHIEKHFPGPPVDSYLPEIDCPHYWAEKPGKGNLIVKTCTLCGAESNG